MFISPPAPTRHRPEAGGGKVTTEGDGVEASVKNPEAEAADTLGAEALSSQGTSTCATKAKAALSLFAEGRNPRALKSKNSNPGSRHGLPGLFQKPLSEF